jgi:quercetin dioxygenase-like cupin family protein
MLDFLGVERTLDAEKEWSMQMHSHPDFEEYWYVVSGKGQIFCGDEVYDVEPEDLVITPRGVPHKAKGDIKFICFTAKHNVYGKVGTKLQYLAHDKPYRKNPKDAPEPGEYMEISPHYDA